MIPTVHTDKYDLYLGDCLDVMREMEAGSVDAVITDPPYFTTESTITVKENNRILNGLRWEDDFLWLPGVERLLSLGCALYVFTGDDQISDLKRAIKSTNMRVFQRLHWIKTNPMPSFTKRVYLGGVELALYCIKDGKQNTFNFTTQNDMHGVWYYPVVAGKERTEHPTQKPVGLIAEWIEDCTNIGDRIFDPFMGSGTTGVACMQLGRKFIGIEIDPKYFEIAEKRIRTAALQEPLFTI